MNSQPKISVIVPVYKVENFLDRCVESIVGQTYENLEIILVDDGSPDNCPAMCDECAKKLNKLISENFALIYSVDYEQDLRIEKATKEKE